MEGTLEIKEFPHQEDKCSEEISQVEERVIGMLEEEEKCSEVEVANLQANGSEGNKDSTKKTKQIHKAKVTVAKPFTLLTEKRMSRERRGSLSMDFKGSKLTLSKSTSLNYNNTSFGRERNSDLKGSGSSTTKTRLKPNVPIEDKTGTSSQEKVHAEEVEKKKPPVAVKKHEGNESNNKLQKNSTFKALPLPRFYRHEAIHPKLEKKKVTHSKPPLASEQGKTVAKSDNTKIEEKGKKVSRKIGASAKETISKLFITTKSSLTTPKEKAIAVVSSA